MFVVVNSHDRSRNWFLNNYHYYGSKKPDVMAGNAFNIHANSSCPWNIAEDTNSSVRVDIDVLYQSLESNPRSMTTIFDMYKWSRSYQWYRTNEFLTRFTVPTREYTVSEFKSLDKYFMAVAKMLELIDLQSRKLNIKYTALDANKRVPNCVKFWSNPASNDLACPLTIIQSLIWDVYFVPLLETPKTINRRGSSISKHYLYYPNVSFDYTRESTGPFKQIMDVYYDTVYRAIGGSELVKYACKDTNPDSILGYQSYLTNYYKGIYNVIEMMYNVFYKGTELACKIEKVRSINSDIVDDYVYSVLIDMWDDSKAKHLVATGDYINEESSRKHYKQTLISYGFNSFNLSALFLDNKSEPNDTHKELVWKDIKSKEWLWFFYLSSQLFDRVTRSSAHSSTRLKFKVKEVKDASKEV